MCCSVTQHKQLIVAVLWLQEAKHWEASFQVYERGTSLFKYPHVADIWAAYLKSFVARYVDMHCCYYLCTEFPKQLNLTLAAASKLPWL